MSNSTVIRRNANVANLNPAIMEETLFTAGGEESEDFVMDISRENTAAILNELTDLSKNPGAYAIREAYSNAYDAVVATGDMTRLIEVTIPAMTDFSEESLAYKLRISECPVDLVRYATITDYGIGMSTEDLRKFFTQYGGTKKQGAGLIGSKGLGSKAPLACADFFDVITVKDGIRSFAHLWRGNGHNYAKIVRTEPTDASDGTSVRIPVVDPKVAEEMRACMDGIAKWNLDANLVYNGEPCKPFLTDGISGGTKDGYVFLGNVSFGKDENGDDVRMRVWQSVSTFPQKLSKHTSWYSNRTTWGLSVDLNLCGVRYPLVEGGTDQAAFIVAGDPGYLNFTPSRDEVKDDDAKQTFLTALSEADYDPDAVLLSLLGNSDFATAYGIMLSKEGYVAVNDDGTGTLVFEGDEIGTIRDYRKLLTFDGIDMSDYLARPKQGYPIDEARIAPASATRYRSVTRLCGKGYATPHANLVRYEEQTGEFVRRRRAYDVPVDRSSFPNREMAQNMVGSVAMPLPAVLPSPAATDSDNGYSSWGVHALNSAILGQGSGYAVVISDGSPDWGKFAREETGIRKLVSSKIGTDPKKQIVTYLFLDEGDAPTEQDVLALGMFCGHTVTTWDAIVEESRKINRKASGGKRGPQSIKLGKVQFVAYDLTQRILAFNTRSVYKHAYDGIFDALFETATKGQTVEIDLDTDDLSPYAFCIGDGNDRDSVIRAAAALHETGKIDGTDYLIFVGTSAPSLTSYPLTMNEVNHILRRRGGKLFADLRTKDGRRLHGIANDVDGFSIDVTWDVPSNCRVTIDFNLDKLGVGTLTDKEMAYAVRNSDNTRTTSYARQILDILGTTFCPALDRVLATHEESWWSQGRSYYRGPRVSITLPNHDIEEGDIIRKALGEINTVTNISGLTSMLMAADSKTAKAILAPGLSAVLQERIG